MPTGVFAQAVQEHDQTLWTLNREVIHPQFEPVAGRNVGWQDSFDHGGKYAFRNASRVMFDHTRQINFGKVWLLKSEKMKI
jgi:hypothetical protein